MSHKPLIDPFFVGIGGIWRHTKTQTEYRLLDVARVEAAPNSWLAVYRRDNGGSTWTRPWDEFAERFTYVVNSLAYPNGMTDIVADLRAFHHACSVPIWTRPHIPPLERKELRRKLIDEEVNKELLPALDNDDLVGIADALADAIYVEVGTALEYGIPLDRVWHAVQQSNMAKIDPVTGKVIRREDGKILKPEGWKPPDIAKIIEDAQCKY